MSRKDEYYNRAKQEGYRSRAAYKLIELDEREDLIHRGDVVVDLGAAPGGWIQVAAAAVGTDGHVVGVDRQPIDPLEDMPGSVAFVRGDLTDPDVLDTIRETLPEGRANVVLSDMAPEMTGEYSLDQARSMYLAEMAVSVATEILRSGGHIVVKVFEGPDVREFRRTLERHFEYVSLTSPAASREASSELYVIGKRFVDAPVAVGERLSVEVTDEGSEGDGIARVAGYTLFVPDTTVGETLEVEVEAVKSSFGFARRTD